LIRIESRDAIFAELHQNIVFASFYRMMHITCMRTTINLDEDVYQLASLYATGRGMTLGAAIGELVRKANGAAGSPSVSPRLKTLPNGLRVFAARGRVITSEMVKAAQEDEIA
jgi:hypothetical protein